MGTPVRAESQPRALNNRYFYLPSITPLLKSTPKAYPVKYVSLFQSERSLSILMQVRFKRGLSINSSVWKESIRWTRQFVRRRSQRILMQTYGRYWDCLNTENAWKKSEPRLGHSLEWQGEGNENCICTLGNTNTQSTPSFETSHNEGEDFKRKGRKRRRIRLYTGVCRFSSPKTKSLVSIVRQK